MLTQESPPTFSKVSSPVDLDPALVEALARIPPLWPLRNFVAVNPFLGLVDRPFSEACGVLERVVGSAPLQSPIEYQRAYERGLITRSDLEDAAGLESTPDTLLRELDAAAADTAPAPLPTVADLLDRERPQGHWSVFVIEEISKWCSVTFDHNQTTWNSPWRNRGLYEGWREAALHDLNPEVFGLRGFRDWVASLPSEADAAIIKCLEVLSPPEGTLVDFLHRQLATISGWAGRVQYYVREDAMRGRANPTLRELLAIRLAYDAALYQAFAQDGALRTNWQNQLLQRTSSRRLAALTRWQFAYEAGYLRQLAQSLARASSIAPATRPVAQAVFCIDVRSEVFRRHLENALPGVQTIGFAGFFGFPVTHEAAGNPMSTVRGPALLVPAVATGDDLSGAEARAAAVERAEAGAWIAFKNSAASCFSFVESVGLAFGAAIAGRRNGRQLSCARARPKFISTPLATRAALAEGALKNMGLVKGFARIVLICGHGSQSTNNPYASGLDCGACGGHAGDINARLAALTLNDPAIRDFLGQRGLFIPSDTFFLAGLHNTTTDDVVLFNVDELPATHSSDLANLQRGLALAGEASRRERAPLLGLAGLPDRRIDSAVRNYAIDAAQVRPEWGLANNAAIVAAPRRRTSGLKLDGRVFLHDYESSADPDSKILSLILCAPVVVASWINLQYYASRIDPTLYGAGNKLLHNVVGGTGVLEGNGGDLKAGLPWQSIHNGERFIHEPRRLGVYIEADPAKIAAVLAAEPTVRQLFDHGWIHLFSIQDADCFFYRSGAWVNLDSKDVPV